MDHLDGESVLGDFTLPSGKTFPGQLVFKRRESRLTLYSDQISEGLLPGGDVTIHGVLSNGRIVTLCGCTSRGITSHSTPTTRREIGEYFPHFIVIGNSRIDPIAPSITKLTFAIEDGNTLFYDFALFGVAYPSSDKLRDLIQSSAPQREHPPQIYEEPEVYWFSGKKIIFESETRIGMIEGEHRIPFLLPGTMGLQVPTKVLLQISHLEPRPLSSTIDNLYALLPLFEILVGRPQNLTELSIQTVENSGSSYELYWSMYENTSGKSAKIRRPTSHDTLIPAGMETSEFAAVLRNWISREDFSPARERFIQSFRKQSNYDIDRLVGIANAFDILPQSATGNTQSTPPDIFEKVETFRANIKALPPTDQRDRILGMLGRIGAQTLKSKISYRASIVIERLGDQLPEFDLVLREAVACRNYFVHGTNKRGIPDFYFEHYLFLTDTLEFTFALSDLIECGFDAIRWSKTGGWHKFDFYLASYRTHLRDIKSA